MLPSSPLKISLHFFCKGISDHRLEKPEIRNRLGERVQCNRTTSDFSRTLRRTQQTGRHRRRVWRIYRHLARRSPWRAGVYPSLSYPPRPKVERGERGAYAISMGGLLSNEIYRSYGNGYPRGGSCPMKMSYRSVASTQRSSNLPSFTIGNNTATLIST